MSILKGMSVFLGMHGRCYSKDHSSYKNYGFRGISICDEWLNDPTLFLKWYEQRYFEKGQVDRINNDGNYSPQNCRIVTPKQNVNNRRNTIIVEIFGEKKHLSAWCEDPRALNGITSINLYTRIKAGWSPEIALTSDIQTKKDNNSETLTINGETKTVNQWLSDSNAGVGLSYDVLMRRVNSGWELEKALKSDVSKVPGQAPSAPKIEAFGESKTLHEWTLDPRCKVEKRTLWYRLDAGWNAEEAIIKSEAKNAGIKYEGKSVLQWSKDPECEVSYRVLMSRLKKDVPLQQALKKKTDSARMM